VSSNTCGGHYCLAYRVGYYENDIIAPWGFDVLNTIIMNIWLLPKNTKYTTVYLILMLQSVIYSTTFLIFFGLNQTPVGNKFFFMCCSVSVLFSFASRPIYRCYTLQLRSICMTYGLYCECLLSSYQSFDL